LDQQERKQEDQDVEDRVEGMEGAYTEDLHRRAREDGVSRGAWDAVEGVHREVAVARVQLSDEAQSLAMEAVGFAGL